MEKPLTRNKKMNTFHQASIQLWHNDNERVCQINLLHSKNIGSWSKIAIVKTWCKFQPSNMWRRVVVWVVYSYICGMELYRGIHPIAHAIVKISVVYDFISRSIHFCNSQTLHKTFESDACLFVSWNGG